MYAQEWLQFWVELHTGVTGLHTFVDRITYLYGQDLLHMCTGLATSEGSITYTVFVDRISYMC
jgi:hypothetical protein